MKNILLCAVLSASISLDAMHATRRVCAEIPKVIPIALKEIAEAFAQETKARDLAVQAQTMIRACCDTNTDSSGIVSNLRVNLLPALIVASAQTRSVLNEHSLVVGVWDRHYDASETGKSQEYIKEFVSCAFTKEVVYRGNEYSAYVEFLRHLSRNPDVLKVTQLK